MDIIFRILNYIKHDFVLIGRYSVVVGELISTVRTAVNISQIWYEYFGRQPKWFEVLCGYAKRFGCRHRMQT